MQIKFTQQNLVKAPGPDGDLAYVIHVDSETHGLGLRVGRTGSRVWVLNYRARGQSRRLTIGEARDWPVPLAREEARRLNRLIDQGHDPLEERDTLRRSPTIADLIERWRQKAAPKKRERSRAEDKSLIRQWIMPQLGKHLVADIRRSDVERLHEKITQSGAPIRANRALALLSRLFNLAVTWEMRADNPRSASSATMRPSAIAI